MMRVVDTHPPRAGRKIVMATHVVPVPPAAGNAHRIYKLLRWLRDEQYEVVLLLREMPSQRIRAEQLAEIERLVHRVHVLKTPASDYARRFWTRANAGAHWIGNGLYNRLGGRYYTRLVRPRVETVGGAVLDAIAGIDPRLQRAVVEWRAGRRRVEVRRSHDRVRALEDLICPDWFAHQARRLCAEARPFAVIAQYIWMSRCLDELPADVLKLIDCHDLSSARGEKIEAYGIDDAFAISIDEEQVRLQRADVIVAIQDGERAAIEAMQLGRRVITVGVDMELAGGGAAPVPKRIVCVAADNPPNVQGLRGFLSRSWPKILAAHPDAALHVVGAVCARLHAPARTTFTRFAPELGAVYDQAELVINPVIAGTGLKIKTVEALAHQKPLVAWPNGVDGIDAPVGMPALVASDWADFTRKVTRLLDDAALRAELAARARAYVLGRCQRQQVYAPLGALLERHRARAGRESG